ncbi:winged helix-turn-helix domain-containing protein [Vibrio sp.]|nr:winged helix-turn-helix domain-containing protein [Vibrio sp.]
MEKKLFTFDNYKFYFDEDILVKNGEKFKIENRLSRLLKFFCENPHTVMSRDELIEQVWERSYGSDQVVTQAIFSLRKILTPTQSHLDPFIKTISKRGYKFTCDAVYHIENSHEVNSEEVNTAFNHAHEVKNNLNERVVYKRSKLLVSGVFTSLILGISSLAYAILSDPQKIEDHLSADSNQYQCYGENDYVHVFISNRLKRDSGAMVAIHETLFYIGKVSNCRFVFSDINKTAETYLSFESSNGGIQVKAMNKETDTPILDKHFNKLEENDQVDLFNILSPVLTDRISSERILSKK